MYSWRKKKQSDSMKEYMEAGEACRQGLIRGLQDARVYGPSSIREALSNNANAVRAEHFNQVLSPYIEPVIKCGCDRCGQFPDFEQIYEPKYLRTTGPSMRHNLNMQYHKEPDSQRK